MIREAIEKAAKSIDLTENETHTVFDEIMSGKASPAQIASILTALRLKGETVPEITGAVRAMRERSIRIDAGKDVIDTCGTGGSPIYTFNISTAAAFVTAGCGVKVAKHGNRSASHHCGSADVLESLGIKLDASPDLVQRCILEIGIGFMYAPVFHSAMKYAAAPRKEIGVRTIFNILGPLSNPAQASRQIMGVYDGKLTEPIARVLKSLGTKHAFVVYGLDGLDEITITGKTRITELKNKTIRTYYVTPDKFGLKRARLEDIGGGDVKENAGIIISIMKGETGPRRDVVLMNASAALVSAGKARDFKAGVKMARESIDSGEALDKLHRLIEITNR